MALSETTKEALAFDPGPAITAEISEGYDDGRAGEPEPGNNRSDWYRHGYCVGRDDAEIGPGRRTATQAARAFLDLVDKHGLRQPADRA